MKKRSMLFFLAAVLSLSMMAVPAAAMDIPETPDDTIITPQAEETEWVYRRIIATGQCQRRLWSITYGYWLTDWIDCVV